MYTAPVPTAADPTAVMGRRIFAYLIDAILVIIVAIGAARGIADFKREDIPPALQRQLDAQDVNVCDLIKSDSSISLCFHTNDRVFYATGKNAAGAVFGLPLLASFINQVVLASVAGGSIGKLILGLRVVRKDTGERAGFGRQLLRMLLWVVDGFPYCLPLVGLITGLTTKGHRRVGDMAAGTLVVSKSSVGVAPVAATAPVGGWAPPGAAPGGWGTTPSGPPPAPGAWAPPGAPAADPWAPPAAPANDPWAPPAAPAETAWAPPAAPAAEPDATWVAPAPQPAPEPDATWVAPAPQPAPAPAPEPTQVAPHAAATTGPQWDAARNAYIQWEPVSGQWMQFDDAAQEWRPLT